MTSRHDAPVAQDRHWVLFSDWCVANDRCPLPAAAAAIAAFLAELPAGPATIGRRVRAIDAAHRDAGLPAPGEASELDEILGRRPVPPRFDPDVVAAALGAIPVGGWPTGIVGRRDAAIVALICVAGLTRPQVQALRTIGGGDLPLGSESGTVVAVEAEGSAAGLLEGMPMGEDPGRCPACALSRWLRVAAQLERRGWRVVRSELADYGEVLAGDETAHACTQAFERLVTGDGRGGSPLFCAIDHHGVPEAGWPISTRSLTGIVAARLTWPDLGAPQAAPAAEAARGSPVPEGMNDHDWGMAQRRAADERFAQMEATLEEAEAEAEAILARVQAAMRDDQAQLP